MEWATKGGCSGSAHRLPLSAQTALHGFFQRPLLTGASGEAVLGMGAVGAELELLGELVVSC